MNGTFSKRIAAGSFLLAMLAGCGNGPSKVEAEKALTALVVPVAQFFGATQTMKVQVDDLKCEKAGDVFKCQVLGKTNGQPWQDGYQFIKLGGEWRATHINS